MSWHRLSQYAPLAISRDAVRCIEAKQNYINYITSLILFTFVLQINWLIEIIYKGLFSDSQNDKTKLET